MSIYVYIYMIIHIHIHIYIYAHVIAYMSSYIYIYIYIMIYIFIYIEKYTYIATRESKGKSALSSLCINPITDCVWLVLGSHQGSAVHRDCDTPGGSLCSMYYPQVLGEFLVCPHCRDEYEE